MIIIYCLFVSSKLRHSKCFSWEMRVTTLYKACKILAASRKIDRRVFPESLWVIQFLQPEINDVFLKRSTKQHWELLENTFWPPVWSIAAEPDKTRRRLLEDYRKPLTRESINTPATPIETSAVTSLCVEGISFHCLMTICGTGVLHKKKSFTCAAVSKKKKKQEKNEFVCWGKTIPGTTTGLV